MYAEIFMVFLISYNMWLNVTEILSVLNYNANKSNHYYL